MGAGHQFAVAYYNNINASNTASAVVTITSGVYKGIYTKNFTINPLNISNASSIASIASQAYSGKEIKPTPAVKYGGITLKNASDYTLSYKNNVNPGTATLTATFKGNYSGSLSRSFTITGASLTYTTHVQNYGWIGSSPSNTIAQNGQMGGTSGKGLRVEALKINLVNNTMYSGGISYKTQIQNIGWQGARTSGGISGTSGRSLRLETLSINLTGQLASYYDIYYRVHAQNIGWMGWAKNGAEAAGTVGLSLRLEAMQIYLVPKTTSPPGSTFSGISTVSPNYPCAIDTSTKGLQGDVKYNAVVHIQNIGDKSYSSVNGSTMLGTSGQSLRQEAIRMSLVSPKYSGSIEYEVHVQNIGDQGWKKSGDLAGTSARSLRLEALRIKLTGTMESKYDIYYRTHVQNIGWTGWAKNGQWSGSAGYAYRMEAMQIVLVDKGTTAPGLNTSYFYKR
jgi:uncharacterized protein YjdB